MIVYVESNFVLEIALQQEQSVAANQILHFAEAGRIELAIPVFSLCEPYSTVASFALERGRAMRQLEALVNQVGRSVPYQSLASDIRASVGPVANIQHEEAQSLYAVAARILSAARVLPLGIDTLRLAQELQGIHELKPKDAMVLAAIMLDLNIQPAEAPKCFVSRDGKDFRAPARSLSPLNCHFIADFADALMYVTHPR
jgi:hypothetical protein